MTLLRWWAREIVVFVLGTAAGTIWCWTYTCRPMWWSIPFGAVTVASGLALAVSVFQTKVDEHQPLPVKTCSKCERLQVELRRANAALALSEPPR